MNTDAYYQPPNHPDLPDHAPSTCSNCDEPLVNWQCEEVEYDEERFGHYYTIQDIVWFVECSLCGQVESVSRFSR